MIEEVSSEVTRYYTMSSGKIRGYNMLPSNIISLYPLMQRSMIKCHQFPEKTQIAWCRAANFLLSTLHHTNLKHVPLIVQIEPYRFITGVVSLHLQTKQFHNVLNIDVRYSEPVAHWYSLRGFDIEIQQPIDVDHRAAWLFESVLGQKGE